MRKNSIFRTIFAFIAALCFSYNTYAASSAVVNSLYNYARTKQITKARYVINNMGYKVDTKDEDGNTAWCIAKAKNDMRAMEVLQQLGANIDQSCGMPWGTIGTVSAVAVAGGAAAALGGGGGGGGGSGSCSDVECGENAHCDKGACVCDSGFLDTEGDGKCYADLKCGEQKHSIGKQYKNSCVCELGYDGTLCEKCAPGYDVYNTDECHLTKICQNNGRQEGDECLCINGWTGDLCQTCDGFIGDDGVCYPLQNCQHGGKQYRDECNCESANGWTGEFCDVCENFEGTDGVCYEVLECKYGGKQVNGECDCSTANGWTGEFCDVCDGFVADNGVCYPLQNCQHGGKQYRDECNCESANGWTGEFCDVCEKFEGEDGGCYEVLECKNGGTQVNNACECANGWTGEFCDVCENFEGSDGGCYEVLSCQHGGYQVNGTCECSTASGWTGELCEVCDGFIGDNGVCYEDLGCTTKGGKQYRDTCDCSTAQGWGGERCDECSTIGKFEGSDGVCYETLACENGSVQDNAICNCVDGWEGTLCNECSTVGKFEGTDGVCYEKLECVRGGVQVNGECDCSAANGWTGTLCDVCDGFFADNGYCYEALDCDDHGGFQYRDTCDCSTAKGWGGDLCNECSSIDKVEGTDGFCYEKLDCANDGTQVNGYCVCAGNWGGDLCNECTGFEGADGGCYDVLECENGSTQVNDSCGCINGWSGTTCGECVGSAKDGVCYAPMGCANGGVQEGDVCNCESANGWGGALCDECSTIGKAEGTDGICYDKIECGHGGLQVNNTCNCESANGWGGNLCNECESIGRYEGDDGICYGPKGCVNGSQTGNECICTNGWEGTLCDECESVGRFEGADGSCYVAINCGEHGTQFNNTCVCDEGYTRNSTGVCVAESVADKVAASNERNANFVFAPEEDETNTSGTKNWTNYSNDNYYGKKYDDDVNSPVGDIVGDQYNLYMAYVLNQNTGVSELVQDVTVNLNNYGDGNVYGIASDANVNNILLSYLELRENLVDGADKRQNVSLIVNNGGEMRAEDGSILYPGENIISGGNGATVGVVGTSSNLYNMVEYVFAGVTNNVERSSLIKVTSAGSGDTIGMATADGNINNGLFSVTGYDMLTYTGHNVVTDKAVVEVENTADGLAAGLYSLFSGTVTNSGIVTVKSNKGVAAGLVSQLTITNSGKVDVSSAFGDVFGIYSNSSVTNSGTVDAQTGGSNVTAINATNITNSGGVSATTTADGAEAYGLKGNGNVGNEDEIIVSAKGNAYGIHNKGTTRNIGVIDVASSTAKAVGILTEGDVRNDGEIYVEGFNAIGMEVTNYTDLENTGTIDVSSLMNGEAYGVCTLTNSHGTFTNSGEISVVSDLNAYGVYAVDTDINNTNNINVVSYNGDAVGINHAEGSWGDEIYDHSNVGSISVTASMGDAYGASLDISNFYNNNIIEAISDHGIAYGISADRSYIENSGSIQASSAYDGQATGIEVSSSTVDNYSQITVSTIEGNAYGIFAMGGNIRSNGDIVVSSEDGDVQGISGDAKVENYGSIQASSESGNVIAINSVDNEVLNEDVGYIYAISDIGKVWGILGDASTITNNGEIEVDSNNTDLSGYAAYGISNVGGIITNNGSIVVDGYTKLIGISSSGNVTNNGSVAVSSVGESYGLVLNSTYQALNAGTITSISTGNIATGVWATETESFQNTTAGSIIVETSNDAYGIRGVNAYNIRNDGSLNITSFGDAYGIYASGSDAIYNSGSIITTSFENDSNGVLQEGGLFHNEDLGVIRAETTAGEAYAVASYGGTVVNDGEIRAVSAENTAIGIYADSSQVVNNDTITVDSTNGIACGIYAEESEIINNGTIVVKSINGDAYGIFANGGTVTNSGTITVQDVSCIGDTCDGGASHIVLNNGAVYINSGVTSYEMSLNLDAFGGTTLLGKNGVFEAESISGTLGVDSSVVAEGFEDTYVEQAALKSEEIDVDVFSNSAMFEASVEQDQTDTANVVMTRKSFEELSSTSAIAQFLEENYKNKNNSLLFSELKKADTASYDTTEAQALGYALLPNFAHENMNVFRNLNATLTDELFTATGVERKMVGYDYLYQSRDDIGTLSGYENYANTMYFMYDVEGDDLIRRGFGMSITQFRSDYEDDSNRKDLVVQALIPVSYVDENGFNFATVLRAGYSDGEYERQSLNKKFEADLTSWVYGLSNAVKYNINLGFMVVEPTAELNVLGFYQDEIDEGDNASALKVDAQNHLSVEAGVGLNLRKDVELSHKSRLSFKAGAMYYHEFAKPYYDLDASMNGMSGSYNITDYERVYDRDRAVLSGQIDFSYKPFTFYGKFKQFIEDDNPFEVNAGIKFNF